MKTYCTAALLLPLGWLVATGVAAQEATPQNLSAIVLNNRDVTGGLIVHLGCADGVQTIQLRANDRFVVHGLDVDQANVDAARKRVASRGLYGPVSIDRLAGDRLPYNDNMVNALVASQLGSVPESEVLRVLVPQGVACGRNRRFSDPGATRSIGLWVSGRSNTSSGVRHE